MIFLFTNIFSYPVIKPTIVRITIAPIPIINNQFIDVVTYILVGPSAPPIIPLKLLYQDLSKYPN